MLKKIVTRNVGVLRAFDTPGSPQLAKLTMIYARNGRGKTTLSAVLRASSCGDALEMRGRQTLGNNSAPPDVTLVFEGGNARFTNGAWTPSESPVEVFDARFIAENLFAGERIELDHDRSLFSVILGRAGVRLARQQEFFKGAAKRAAAGLKEAEAALNGDIPSDMTREEFLGHVPHPDADDLIEQARKELRAVQQVTRLTTLKLLEPLTAPSLPLNLRETLARTIGDIDATARDRLAAHFEKHKLGKRGEEWVRFGLERLKDDDCPFCGRDGVDELGLVSTYQQIFGEAYQTHFIGVKDLVETIETAIGSAPRESIARTIAANAESAREWAEFCNLGAVNIPDLEPALIAVTGAHEQLKNLADMKRQTPLGVIENEEAIRAAEEALATAIVTINAYNEAVEGINIIAQKRRAGPQPSEAQARLRVENLAKRKRRADPSVQSRIDAVLSAKRRDARAKKIRSEVQKRLKKANDASADHYHQQVNYYLERFGATFRISEISNSMTGNLGSVDYGLVVRGHRVSRGRKGAAADEPTFQNTLSTGDKTTLAFAFFLAGLDRDAGLAGKVIVFDDPLSSHDTHRQGKTVDLLSHLCGRCEQVVLLSHDAHFLRRVSRRCPTVDKVVYEIDFDGPENWAKARMADLDELCQSDHSLLLRRLHEYHQTRVGHPTDVAPAVRKVLETHYRRSYTAYFDRDDNLGTIISKIRAGGDTHPCHADLFDLESCNAATSDEHHGDDPLVAPSEPVDPDGLAIVVKDSLELVGALRRPAASSEADPRADTTLAVAGAR